MLLILAALPAVAAAPLPFASAKPGPDWKQARLDREMAIFFRDGASANAREVRAVTEIGAPPWVVFNVVTDFENYPKFMPYAREARVLKRDGDATALVYSLSAPPVIAWRDLVAEIRMTRGTTANGGVFRSEWMAKPDLAPLRPGVVRIKLSTGFWSLEPIDNGRSTRVTYSVLTSPGGAIPRAFADQSTNDGIAGLFAAVRKRATGRP
jgi:uncharacterized protein YndB with AHSA1/START domain